MQAIQEPPQAGTDEISRLRQQLAERELSVMRAILANSELQQKVAEAEDQAGKLKTEVQKLQAQPSPAEALAEIVRLKKEWSLTQKAQQREHADRRAELVKVRSQLHQTQKKYEDESKARRTESAQASSVIARMDRDMGDLRLAAKKTREEQAAEHKSHWKFVVATVVAMAAVCTAVIAWPSHSNVQAAPPAVSVSHTTTQTSTSPVASGGPVKHLDLPPAAFETGSSGPEFSNSLSRLNESLSSVSNRTPEDVLREVHLSRAKEEPDLCAFQWNAGQPSLLFNHDRPNATIASSLNRCAQAVDAWKRQKNAPASSPGR